MFPLELPGDEGAGSGVSAMAFGSAPTPSRNCLSKFETAPSSHTRIKKRAVMLAVFARRGGGSAQASAGASIFLDRLRGCEAWQARWVHAA